VKKKKKLNKSVSNYVYISYLHYSK